MKSQQIEVIKKKFHREWLLIDVDKFDESTTTPISGRLLAHSPRRSDVYAFLKKIKRPHLPHIEYSEDNLPKGYAVAFLNIYDGLPA